MSRISPDVWGRLTDEAAQGESLRARRAIPEVTERLIAAIDALGHRHLLVPLLENDDDVHDAQSRGIAATTRDLIVPGHESGRYVDLACNDATGWEAFDIIGGELADRLSTGTETADECVTRVLAKWRRFWSQVPVVLLSVSEQVGLFAELWFLRFWLLPRVGTTEATTRWRGPFGSRHDFEWQGRSVEVKATLSTRGPIHCINGLEQLVPPDDGTLLLFSVQVREEAGAEHSLPSIISDCREALADDELSLERLDQALAQCGYSPAHEQEYAKLHLRISNQGLFTVSDDFPRLTSTNFVSGIPSGLERVEYEINLGGFERLCIARRPEDSFEL